MTTNRPHFINNCLQRLDLVKSRKEGPLLSSLHHFDEFSGRTTQKRADRRANIFHVLQIMLPQIDLDTFTWGQWFTRHDGKTDFYTRGIDYIAQQTGMCHKTICRSLSDLEKAGYLKVKRTEGMGKDGSDIRYYSLRTFTNKFFRELGFLNKTIERTRAWKRKKNETSFYGKKATSKCLKGIGRIQSLFNKHSSKPTSSTKHRTKLFKSIPSSKQSLSTRDTSNLLSKASEMAERQGRQPLVVYRELLANIQ